MITEDMITAHKLPLLKHFSHSTRDWYLTFLIQTDYVANKLVEAQALGDSIEEYTDIIKARKYAREQINAIDNGTYTGEQAGTDIPIMEGEEVNGEDTDNL